MGKNSFKPEDFCRKNAEIGVAVFGNINIDTLILVEELPQKSLESNAMSFSVSGGGSAANTAVALARLGVPSIMLGAVGEDLEAEIAIKELDRENVITKYIQRVRGERTGRVWVLIDKSGERTMIAYRGANIKIKKEFNEALIHSVWLHIGGGLLETALEVAAAAEKKGIPVSYDPGSAAYLAPQRLLSKIIEKSNLVILNEFEYKSLIKRNIRLSQLFIVKKGAKGSEAVVDGEKIHAEGFKVKVKDSTGAGDAFNAAFIAALLSNFELKEALIFANAAAAIKVSRLGARSSPSLEEVVEFLEKEGYGKLAMKVSEHYCSKR